MQYLRNEFIKYLMDEVLRKSFATAMSAHKEVIAFSMTKEFDIAFKQWLKISKQNKKTSGGPKHIFYGK